MRISLWNGCWIATACFWLTACNEPRETNNPNVEPLVVYADYAEQDYLPALFARYTEQTGVPVTVRHAGTDTIVSDVILNRGTPPADVLLAPTASAVWRVADEGALRLLRSDIVEERVPAMLRDPDGHWTAASFHYAVIAYNPDLIDVTALEGYAGLAEQAWRGKLCLSSSTLPINRTVIAMLIDELDVRPAEIVVRGWLANLAQPVFDSERALLDAIAAGRCELGIASSSALGVRERQDASLGGFVPSAPYADIEGIGIARHARQPELALGLLEWLLSEETQRRHHEQTANLPVAPVLDDEPAAGVARNVSIAGWQHEAAVQLAARAAYR